MRKKTKKFCCFIISLFFRYLLLILASFNNLAIFYTIFTPLTIYPVYFLLNLISPTTLSGTALFFKGFQIKIVEACVAGSAYYLLLILNLTTPMPFKKRIYSIFFLFFSFLLINITRIFAFSILLTKSFSLFKFTHLLFWYFLSGIFVFLIWFFNTKLFKIKEIPIYSDIKKLYHLLKS